MRKFLLRTGLAVVMLPGLWALIFPFNGCHFIGLHIVVTLFITIGAFEVSNFFEKAGIPVFGRLAPILAATLVPASYIGAYLLKSDDLANAWFALILCFLVIRACFPLRRVDFSKTIPRIASSVFIVVYPGFFSIYIVRIFSFENPQYVFLFFLLLVFINEIAAYIFGKLAGGRTRLNLPISPNKTAAGFISGFAFTIIAAGVLYALFPGAFKGGLILVLLIGAIMGLSGIFGDLFESALKRACGLKDSGTIMAGRGGIMDTIDSVLLSAPLFYIMFRLIQQFSF